MWMYTNVNIYKCECIQMWIYTNVNVYIQPKTTLHDLFVLLKGMVRKHIHKNITKSLALSENS